MQQASIEEQRLELQNQIRALKARVRISLMFRIHTSPTVILQYPRHVPMPAREKRKLNELEQQDAALCRNEESIIIVRESLFFKCRYIYRPVQIIVGLFLFAIAALIFISLLLSNINKCLHFVSFKEIFAQGNQTLPNPIDRVLTWTGQVRTNISMNSHFTSFPLLVLPDQLYFFDWFACIHHLHVSLWLTTTWYLVLLGSSKF